MKNKDNEKCEHEWEALNKSDKTKWDQPEWNPLVYLLGANENKKVCKKCGILVSD